MSLNYMKVSLLLLVISASSASMPQGVFLRTAAAAAATDRRLENNDNQIEQQYEGEDDDYMGCFCPCNVAESNTEGVVAMIALDESLLGPDGDDYICVSEAQSIQYNTDNSAVCDESCYDDLMDDEYDGDDDSLGDDEYDGDDAEGGDDDDDDDEEDFE